MQRPKQTFQISKQGSVQPSTQSISFSGAPKPKQTFQISSSHQNATSTNSISFSGEQKPKQQFLLHNYKHPYYSYISSQCL